MRVTFVNLPNAWRVRDDLAPPLWALTLGSIARQEGLHASLLDLNLEFLEGTAPADTSLYEWAELRLAGQSPDVVCFSSMGVNSHVGIELARRIKRSCGSLTLFGGPHFGAVGPSLMQRFPWMDVVISGEGENAFRELARQRFAPCSLTHGLCDRRVAGWQRDPLEPSPRVSAAEMVHPDYGLADLERYFRVNGLHVLDFEGGQRGCIYSCPFCYAPRHFGRGDRRAGTDWFIEDLHRGAQLGADRFFFVQDNFVNSPLATIDQCHRIQQEAPSVAFHCYATLLHLTAPVIDALAGAGCRSVYVGVDAVDDNSRRSLGKGMFDGVDDMLTRVDNCRTNGISPVLAFLLEEPEKGRDRIESTIAAAVQARLRGCSVRLGTLTLYPGTPQYKAFGGHYSPDDLHLHLAMDLPEVVLQNDWAAEAPDLFTFHSTHRSREANTRFQLGVHAICTLMEHYPDSLLACAKASRAWELADRIAGQLDAREMAALPNDEQRRLQVNDAFRRLVLERNHRSSRFPCAALSTAIAPSSPDRESDTSSPGLTAPAAQARIGVWARPAPHLDTDREDGTLKRRT